jgi:hypothetical protein
VLKKVLPGADTGVHEVARRGNEMERASLGGGVAMLVRLLLVVLLVGGAGGTSYGQDDTANGDESDERDLDSEHCVRINDIEQIQIVDADTLVFRMRGGAVYRNELPHRCPGLRPDDTLMYRSSVGRLCSIDMVTVLEDWGFGYAPGASCGLGMFEPITAQIADEMVKAGE